MAGPLITLTTDFGTADGFVGTMKGVILGICPGATIVDISHEVPRHDIAGASFVFANALPHFPPGSIHVLVVDPGVGTDRDGLVVMGPDATFVCPDNGVLSGALAAAGAFGEGEPFAPARVALPPGWSAHRLTNQDLFRQPVSSTFHGRDVFAPVAAQLANGVPPAEMGDAVEAVTTLALPAAAGRDGAIDGHVMHVDVFGNLITNVDAALLGERPGDVRVEIAGRSIAELSGSYQSGTGLVALIGSHGGLEIAVPNGSAASLLGVERGEPLRVVWRA